MPTPSSQPNPKFNFAEPSNRTPPIPDAFKSSPPGALAKFQTPPATPIFPQPINPPPAPVPAPLPAPSAASRSVGRTGGRIAGSFKMPPGAGVAARAGAATVGRRIPYVALAFFAYDAYQLACSLQLIPGSICPRPDNPSPGGFSESFKGGQCCDSYHDVYGFIFFPGYSLSNREQKIGNYILGTINGIVESRDPNDPERRRFDLKSTRCNGTVSLSNLLTTSDPGVAGVRISRIDVITGSNNCGDPPPSPQPQRMPDQINNITNFNRNININFTVPKPAPPSPQPKPAPRIISPPSPFPDININFGDNYFGGGDTDFDFDIDFNFSPAPKGNFNDYPDIFNNFPPSPQPQTKDPDPFPKENPPPQPAPQPKPLPEIPPPISDKLPDNSTDQDKYIYRQNKETLDKVYKANAEILEIQKEQKKQSKILENIQSLLDFEVEGEQIIKRCDDIEIFYSYKDKILKAINKQLDHVKKIEQTLINEVCSIEADTVTAIPEWWERRLQSDIPQLALIFRSVGTKTYHKLSIPHPINTAKLANPPIVEYQKGNFQAQIICLDNSKFIVNCLTKEESERVANIALSLIDINYKGQSPKLWFAERRGEPVLPGSMKATSAMYFSQGQRNTVPVWRVAFRKDGM
jgi:hypothetical protein